MFIDDILMATQTCKEIIQFSARMRLPANMSDAQIQKRAADVMEELNLTKVRVRARVRVRVRDS